MSMFSRAASAHPSALKHPTHAQPQHGFGELLVAGVGVVAVLLIGVAAWQWIQMSVSPGSNLATAEQLAGLAAFPDSASNIVVYHCTAYVDTQYYVAATLPPSAIDTYIRSSPGISRSVPDRFDVDHEYLMLPSFDLDFDSHHGPPPFRYFSLPDDVLQNAAWYDPSIDRSGCRYIYVRNGNTVEVDIDNHGHRIYFRVIEG